MDNNKLALVTFEQAVKLGKAGFDWPTYGHHYVVEKIIPPSLDMADRALYNVPVGGLIGFDHGKNTVPAPTVALALKWMRDVKDLKYAIFYDCADMEWFVQFRGDDGLPYLPEPHGDDYEVAESALLDELLTLIEE